MPGGYFYRQPEIAWDSKKVLGLHPSFTTLVNAVISARKANPHHLAKHKWATDTATVANEVEAFQVRICQSMNWQNYLTDAGGSAAGPFSSQSLLNAGQLSAAVGEIKKLWAGIKSVNEWLTSGAPAVPTEQAEKRAAVCALCPMNGQGDWSRWFTAPAQGAITKQLEKLQERKLSTSLDDKLAICTACLCPNKLSVHAPLEIKLKNMAPDVKAALHESCWVTAEERELATVA